MKSKRVRVSPMLHYTCFLYGRCRCAKIDPFFVSVRCKICRQTFPSCRHLERHKRRCHTRKRQRSKGQIRQKRAGILTEREEDELASSTDEISSDQGYKDEKPEFVTVEYPATGLRKLCFKMPLDPEGKRYSICFIFKPLDKERQIRVSSPLKLAWLPGKLFNVNGLEDLTCNPNLIDVMMLIVGKPVSSILLEAYFELLVSRYNRESRNVHESVRSSECVLLSPRFMQLSGERQLETPDYIQFQPNLSLLPKHFPQDGNFILIAPLYIWNHFYLACFDNTTRQVFVYDSSWAYFPLEVRRRQVERILCTCFQTCVYEWTIYFQLSSTPQIDETSCSAYVVYYAENFMEGRRALNRKPIEKRKIREIRYKMARALLQTSEHGRLFLNAIS